MSFEISNFGRSTLGYNKLAHDVYTYKTETDNLNDVSQAGYFDGAFFMVKEGDHIFVHTPGNVTLLQISNSVKPLTTEYSVGSIEHTFASSTLGLAIPRIVGEDSVYGPLWELTNYKAGTVPNGSNPAFVILFEPEIIDFEKPVAFSVIGRNVASSIWLRATTWSAAGTGPIFTAKIRSGPAASSTQLEVVNVGGGDLELDVTVQFYRKD